MGAANYYINISEVRLLKNRTSLEKQHAELTISAQRNVTSPPPSPPLPFPNPHLSLPSLPIPLPSSFIPHRHPFPSLFSASLIPSTSLFRIDQLTTKRRVLPVAKSKRNACCHLSNDAVKKFRYRKCCLHHIHLSSIRVLINKPTIII